ncbi:hypothetical protein PHET_11011, partial [Paragonimus heterotremus]
MDFIKGYVANISDFVARVVDDPPETVDVSSEITIDNQKNLDTEPVNEVGDKNCVPFVQGGLLSWIPTLKTPTGESAVAYYMNSLASFGGGQSEIDVSTFPLSEPSTDVKTVIVEDIPQVPPPSLSPSVELNHSAEAQDLDADLAFTTWFTGLTSRTEEAWKQMKHDFHEIVSVISTEPKDAVTRTASSVRQHLSAVADAARNIDPYQFTILPANDSTETTNVEQIDEIVAKDHSDAPSDLSSLPILASLRSDVSQFVSGVVSTLFGSGETSPPATKDRRE